MQVHNPQSHGVFVQNYGVIPAESDATVRKSEAVDELLANGTLTEKSSASNSENKESDG
jgi:hypothetical protein